MPKLSIITINLNNASGLRKTIESVVSQTFKDYEYIIIDGGSTDGSVDVIKEYAVNISYWVSEPDTGIYNAMNKGIKIAGGDYCLFLNSGDWLNDPNGLAEVFRQSTGEDLIYWNIITTTGNIVVMPEELTLYRFIFKSLAHQSTLIRRSLFSCTGAYNETYKIVADWEFFLRLLLKYKFTYKHVPITVSTFDINGISCSERYKDLRLKERAEILEKNLSPFILKDYEAWKADRFRLKQYDKSKLVQLAVKLKTSRPYKFVMGILIWLRKHMLGK